jgi:NTE family protein
MLKKFAISGLAVLLSVSLSGCAGARRKAPPTPSEPAHQGAAVNEGIVDGEPVNENYGPNPPAEESPAVTEAEPAVPAEAKLCIVLGPGMAKAMAQASVLEAIRRAQIPVHCVVGTEMGAVVGALFAHANGNANSLQWQLFKIKRDNYFNFPMISLREPRSSGERLHEFLEGIFRAKRIEDLPIRFATSATEEDGNIVYFERGNLADALSASLAIPGIFEPWEAAGREFVSGAVTSPAPLELARRLGGNFIVLVDVLEDTSGSAKGGDRFKRAFAPVRNLIRLQKKDANFVIQVPAGAVGFDDFGQQGEIFAAGARAAERAVPELKAAWERWSAGAR